MREIRLESDRNRERERHGERERERESDRGVDRTSCSKFNFEILYKFLPRNKKEGCQRTLQSEQRACSQALFVPTKLGHFHKR